MREIKFRAWDKKPRKWVEITAANVHGEDKVGFPVSTVLIYNGQDECEVMQYTGLKDKNGVEIYEGDIVSLDNHNHQVVYDPAIFRLANSVGEFTTTGYPDWDLCEVIGNIYEHPSLIKGRE